MKLYKKLIKRHLTSIVIREMQIRTSRRCSLPLGRLETRSEPSVRHWRSHARLWGWEMAWRLRKVFQ